MSLVIETFEDLVHIIETNPEWRRRLKRSMFDIDIEAALTRLEKAIEELVETQHQQARDIAELKAAVLQVVEIQGQHSKDIAELKSDVKGLKSDVKGLKSDVATLKGKAYENEYWNKANAIFGRVIRRGRNLTDDVADQLHDAGELGKITSPDIDQVLAADLLWGGKLRKSGEELLLVLEASWRAETHDVERAHIRAEIMRRIGVNAIGVVAGMEWDEEALKLAHSLKVAVASNDKVDDDLWQNANTV